MATQLKNIVNFVGVAAGATVALPHYLNVNDVGVIPDVLETNIAPFLGLHVTASATNVTLTNVTGSPIDVDVLCEYWHSIERALGSAPLTPRPFVVGGGAALAPPAPALTGIRRNILNNTLTPLFSVDMTLTTTPPGVIPDYTWGGKLFFSAECSDGTDRQVREGDVNVALAMKLPATVASSQAQNVTGATTLGTFTSTFSWTVVGTVATLNVTMLSSLVPTSMTINFFLLYATHAAFTYIP